MFGTSSNCGYYGNIADLWSRFLRLISINDTDDINLRSGNYVGLVNEIEIVEKKKLELAKCQLGTIGILLVGEVKPYLVELNKSKVLIAELYTQLVNELNNVMSQSINGLDLDNSRLIELLTKLDSAAEHPKNSQDTSAIVLSMIIERLIEEVIIAGYCKRSLKEWRRELDTRIKTAYDLLFDYSAPLDKSRIDEITYNLRASLSILYEERSVLIPFTNGMIDKIQQANLELKAQASPTYSASSVCWFIIPDSEILNVTSQIPSYTGTTNCSVNHLAKSEGEKDISGSFIQFLSRRVDRILVDLSTNCQDLSTNCQDPEGKLQFKTQITPTIINQIRARLNASMLQILIQYLISI